jgi:hypothetical protein
MGRGAAAAGRGHIAAAGALRPVWHQRQSFTRLCAAYKGRTTLFRAGGSLAPEAEDLTSGWGALVDSKVHLLDADHESVLRSPALDRMVEDLRQDLAKAD